MLCTFNEFPGTPKKRDVIYPTTLRPTEVIGLLQNAMTYFTTRSITDLKEMLRNAVALIQGLLRLDTSKNG